MCVHTRRACEKYVSARLLIECVLLTASDPADRRLLQGFAQMFADQFTRCEQSKNMLLEFGDSSSAQKANSPVFASTIEATSHRTLSH